MRLTILCAVGLVLLDAMSCRSKPPKPEIGSETDVAKAVSAEVVSAEAPPEQSGQNVRVQAAGDTSPATGSVHDTARGEGSLQQTQPTADSLLREVNEWHFQASPEERSKIGEAMVQLANRSDAPSWRRLVTLSRWSLHGEPGRYLLLGDRPGGKGGRDMDGTLHGLAWYAIEFTQDTIAISEPWDVGVCILCFGVAMDSKDLDGDSKPDLVFCTWTIPSEDEEAEVPPSKPIAISWREGAWNMLDAPSGACKEFVPTAP